MSGDAARTLDPEFPNLAPDVVDGYRNAPESMTAEVLDGELFVMPRPRLSHARSAGRLAGRLRHFDDPQGDEPGGWVILPEPELRLGVRPDIVAPDLAGWRRERLPVGFAEGVFATLAPDWVCEVLSPGTARIDRKKKLPIYLRERVGHIWLVDPSSREIEVFRWTPDGWLLVGAFQGDDVVRAEPFDAAPLDLAGLWIL